MIITRTPFRVSFIGGGSDLREFYTRNDYGAVVSAAITKYMYIIIHPYFHDKVRIKYSKTEDVCHVEEITHPLVRECLKKVVVEKGVEIASFADVPAGTGLGSSSAFTVGLLHALYAFKGETISKEKLAQEACEIEIDVLGEPIGKQDQYAAAYGGINVIRFNHDETVMVSPITISANTKKTLEKNLRLYFTGETRRAKDILNEQKMNMAIEEKYTFLKDMLSLVEVCRRSIETGDVDTLGTILHEGWILKKQVAQKITTGVIDELYQLALDCDATGGKVLGAGGGGFLLLYANDQEKVQSALGCKALSFEIDHEGTKILFSE